MRVLNVFCINTDGSFKRTRCMAKKRIKTNGIFFTGKASEDVTGSQYYLKYGTVQILLECGLHQSSTNSYLDSYKVNSDKFQFKPNEIDYIFLNHAHIDHIGLVPRIVKEGFCGKIIATHETAVIMKSLLLNSCFILADEARVLSKRYHRDYQPIYTIEDVYRTMELVYEYDSYDTEYILDNRISFKWYENSHCPGAAQLGLKVSDGYSVRHILYTSDIGALYTKNHYLKNTVIPRERFDVAIMESTYGSQTKINKKNRKFDIEHLCTAINTTLERKGTVILPCFSFSRTQEILTTLYDIYGKDENFVTPVVVDSKLSCEISDLYSKILDGNNLTYWKKVKSWNNVKFISEKTDSQACLSDNTPKIVISSSGFCTNGRIVNYLKKYLRDKNSMIIFSGFVGENPSYLSYRIKNFSQRSHISINKELIPNHADCISLSTFSSHANYDDLVTYGGSLETNKLILVHGSSESKRNLSEGLKKIISKNNKTFKVVSAHKGMVIHL